VAVVTGASSGIGEATARTLAGLGFHVVCVARREDRIRALADEIGGTATVADVTVPEAVDALAAGLDRVDVLVNNAGGAKGTEPVADADLENWRWMWETNVMGTLRVTRALLPKLVDSGDGLIVTITSIAAFEIYDGGADTPRPSTPKAHCTARCAASCWESRCGSPRLRQGWWRRSSPSSGSAAIRTRPTRCIRG